MWNENICPDVPLCRALLDYRQKNPARFHTPGHKGAESSPLAAVFGPALALDVTELPETDSLFEASGVIAQAEERAAAAFGTAQTLFSAGGASLCIQAMFRLVSQSGRRTVVCARNVHRSAVNAMSLLGLDPVWVWPRPFEGSSLPGAVEPDDVERALSGAQDAAAVFLTSPDYYGVMSDIAGIAAVCRRHGVPLLVDNAHGAHLFCLDEGALHPLRLGAAMCCDSAHKTLPVLTGGAFLQIADGRFAGEQAKDAMALFGSTSPSYLILASLDLARAWMERDGAAAFGELREKTREMMREAERLGFGLPDGVRLDPTRITLDTAGGGAAGPDAARFLRECGISPEMNDDRQVVLLPSPFTAPEEFERLRDALRRLPVSEKTAATRNFLPEHPVRRMSPHEALTAPCETVAAEQAAGRTAAEGKCPCPPGIPLIMPGEAVSENLAIVLKNYGVNSLKVLK